jgi:hypothetical protein
MDRNVAVLLDTNSNQVLITPFGCNKLDVGSSNNNCSFDMIARRARGKTPDIRAGKTLLCSVAVFDVMPWPFRAPSEYYMYIRPSAVDFHPRSSTHT